MVNAASLTPLPESVGTILVTRLDGLGDIVLGTMLLSGLRRRWPGAAVTLLVRPQMAGVGAVLPEWVRVVPLPLDPRQPVAGREAEIVEKLSDFAAECRADMAVIAEYNRTWAGEIVASLSGAARVMAFDGPTGLNLSHGEICAQLHTTTSQAQWQIISATAQEREPAKYVKFLDALGVDGKSFLPEVVIREEDRRRAQALWDESGLAPRETVVCFPGSGEQLVRSLEPTVWARWIGHLNSRRPLALLGGTADEPVLDAIAACGLPGNVRRMLVPADQPGLLAALLERAGGYVGMDTGPMHVAAALGRPTLGIFGGGHCAERFLPVGPHAAAVRMPLGCYGCDWHCPFDRRLCIKSIPEDKLIEAGDAFLKGFDNPDPASPRVFEIDAPADLPAAVLGPVMRQHNQFLTLNHALSEHHVHLARDYAHQKEQIAQLSTAVASAVASMAEIARQNHERGEAMVRVHDVLARMTERNQQRDSAIAHLSETLAEMTRQNAGRDQAINHLSATLAEMTKQNASRDGAIGHANDTLAEMTRQIAGREKAVFWRGKRGAK
jgi:ADP-heptose:LPS heptosyltransferase